jgi:acetylornithine aminotransferase
MARSGKMFAFQHESIKPDVLTLAKALGNGIPVGACLASGKAKDVFQPGNHGSTFGGNPFACQVAFTVTSIMSDEKLADNAKARGQQLVDTLKQQLSDNDDVVEIRNLGLLVGITLKQSCHEMVTIALQNKLLINVTADNVIRLLPPLVINEQQTSEIADRLVKSIKQFTNK